MPTKAPVVPVNWTGLYIGGGGGYGAADVFTTPLNSLTGVTQNSGANNGARGYFGRSAAATTTSSTTRSLAACWRIMISPISMEIPVPTPTHFFFEPFGGAQKLSSSWGVGSRIGWLVHSRRRSPTSTAVIPRLALTRWPSSIWERVLPSAQASAHTPMAAGSSAAALNPVWTSCRAMAGLFAPNTAMRTTDRQRHRPSQPRGRRFSRTG